jgi:hypothetical protein
MEKVDLEVRRMLLSIAYSFGDRKMLPFIEFAKLVVAVLEAETEGKDLFESVKAETVYELWKEYAAGRRPRQLS